ncbi:MULTISPECIES: NAD(P)H-hydrate dehydratase [unclassified Sphingobacterium]|uniref:NAD(P)H-hydrate dehydratase n=1 Tax=unclassified Sphingobacterium TaxID=2609468 RepID=UPI00182CD8A3|nr:NAD(P)H-hydrate dehydratase [Sphingobacterium sp. B16(2022)]NJI73343.1 NAD(P)H-hydrate dehydratase [Sphingobacterium sp. B16(2022)]
MKILTAKQMMNADVLTCNEQQITSLDLMERASQTVFAALKIKYPDLPKQHFTIICGKGNNGGDGLVLARLLDAHLANVMVYVLKSEIYAPDNSRNQARLSAAQIHFFNETDQLQIPDNTIVIDCLFGYGLREELDGKWAYICKQINEADVPVYAIDMPSGLLADRPTSITAPVIHADLVYTFQMPKLALLMPQNQVFYDDFQILDIQLSKNAIEKENSDLIYVEKGLILKYYRKRKKFEHKGNFGHSMIIGGSKGKMGSVQLALKAALRSGCGLATAFVPACGHIIIQTAVPEAMVLLDDHNDVITTMPDLANYQAVGIGVGMGTAAETSVAWIDYISRGIQTPLIIDADGLNMMSKNPELWSFIPKNTILTPHPKELNRIIGSWMDDWDKLEKVKEFASKYQVNILIKGANSAMVMSDGKIYLNSTGNVGMATGGSGDVLTGIITALLGQGYPANEALIMGVYLHGKAADLAVKTIGTYSLLPSDIIQYLPQAFLELELATL